MTTDEKVGQLVCLISYNCDEKNLINLAKNIKSGGLMLRTMPAAQTVADSNTLQWHSATPMLIAANLEAGGSGVVTEGTKIGSPLQGAATVDVMTVERLGYVCEKERRAVSVSWASAPIVDIDYNFRNTITKTRTFRSNPETVEAMGLAYIESLQSRGMAATAKHFPGDGVDERDHHLVKSINDLSCEQ